MGMSDQAFVDYVERSTDDVIHMRQEYEAQITRLRRALDILGVPAQARLDDKGPPLRITVERAREIMGMVEE